MASVGPALAQTLPDCTEPVGCNLLGNPSFEQAVGGQCPNSYAAFGSDVLSTNPWRQSAAVPPQATGSYVCNWHSGNPSGSPDLFNVCTDNWPNVGVPCNIMADCSVGGHTTRTGDGYAGINAFTYYPDPINSQNKRTDYEREYIAQNVTLNAGQRYYAEFYVSIAPNAERSVSSLGLGFSTATGQFPNWAAPFAAAVSGPVGNAPGWTKISGYFTATGQEKQLVIGYFGPGYQWGAGNTPTYNPLGRGPGRGQSYGVDAAYYFIEDVILQAVPTAGPERDLLPCHSIQLGTCALPTSSGATYSWSPTTGLNNPNSATPTVQAGVPGTATTYTLTVSTPRPNQSNLLTSSTVVVSTSPLTPLTVTMTRGSACLNGTQLTASGGDGVTYTWSPVIGLSATMGSVVNAAPSSTTTYTVTSSCGTTAQVEVAVDPNSCLLEDPAIAEMGMVEVEGGTYSQFAGSPFDTPRGIAFHLKADTYLTNDVFTLAPGSMLLFDTGVSLHLDQGAALEAESAWLTAACRDMWGGVYVHADARGIRLTGPAGCRSRVEHSYEGIVVEEKNSPACYFEFTDIDFAHNRRGIMLRRHDSPPLPTDLLERCTFTSDPQYFKAPWNPTGGIQRYSEVHVALNGDFRDVSINGCSFSNCMIGIHTIWPARTPGAQWQTGSAGRIINCLFDNFRMAGVVAYSDSSTGAFTPAGELVTWDWQMHGNRFHFPERELAPNYYDQTAWDQYHALLIHHFYPFTFGVISNSNRYGAELVSNSFEQLRADTGGWNSYADLRHVGVYGGDFSHDRLERNRFYQLQTGTWHYNWRLSSSMDLRSNLFLNCTQGLLIGENRYSSIHDGLVLLSCNSYVRADGGWRSGQPVGIANHCRDLTMANYEDRSTGYYLLKEIFVEKPGSAPMTTLFHYGQRLLDYLTFDNYAVSIRSRAQRPAGVGVNLDVHGPNPLSQYDSQPGQGGNVCANDGFSNTGIQLRPTASVAAPAVASPAVALAQNRPNPANETTEIGYGLPRGSKAAELVVREGVSGRTVLQLPLNPAASAVTLDVRKLPSGLYFYSLLADGVPTQTRRLLVEHH